MRKTWFYAVVLIAGLLAACGGSGGGNDAVNNNTGNTGTGGGNAGTGTANPGPGVALLMSNGHSPLLPNYLEPQTGPQLTGAIQAAGFTVETSYFADDQQGYVAFVAKLQQIRDNWIKGRANPTRVVIVGHSHGCVRSHAAMRALMDCPVELLVDLDGSSIGWSNPLAHGNEDIGGAPEGAYNLGVQLTRQNVASAGGPHDLEDVVFPQVSKAYEVRSGAMILNPNNITQLIEYDERWNARTDGSTTNLTYVFSNTPHAEVATAGGTTMAGVQAWITNELGTP